MAQLFLEILGGADDPVDRLLTASTDELLAASDELFSRIPTDTPGTLAFGPVVDGTLIPDYRQRVLERHRAASPVADRYEQGRGLTVQTDEVAADAARPGVIRGMFAEIAAEHPDVEFPDQARIESAYSGLATRNDAMGLTRDFGFRLPTLWIVEAHSRYAPTWLYRFDYATPMLKALKIGATHATELPYVFGNIAHGPREITYLLADCPRHEGCRSGCSTVGWPSPRRTPLGLEGEPEWRAYDRDGRSTLVIDKHDTVVADLDGPLRARGGRGSSRSRERPARWASKKSFESLK